mmetsp:Transcript_33811/g.61050  ORF Transcript_33811/g.61050 Transcript_33811/m.61050 type:complete len:85 (-) Transcript_33811:725-979(-)
MVLGGTSAAVNLLLFSLNKLKNDAASVGEPKRVGGGPHVGLWHRLHGFGSNSRMQEDSLTELRCPEDYKQMHKLALRVLLPHNS